MSDLARLAGSVICAGLAGERLDDAARRELAALQPGGLILFARNVTTLAGTRALLADASAAASEDVPPLRCVDQEGGRVVRLRFSDVGMPSALTLGAANDAELARRAGAQIAREVLGVGANVVFAPVLDLALEPGNTVIGTRALGDDPRCVATLGAALVRGIEGCGAVATLKHFPGHGATSVDSHRALPISNVAAVTLRERELVPFRAALLAGARAVMTAHIVVRSIDPDVPATLSRRVLTGVLRGELGFDGVVFTDCLQMEAIAGGVGTSRAAVLAIAAGADCVVVSHSLPVAREARDALVAAVRSSELPLARLEQAAERVRRLRLGAVEVASDARTAEVSPALEIARRAITVVRGDPRLNLALPVSVISFEGDASDGIATTSAERPSLNLELRRRRLRSEALRVPLEPAPALFEMLLDVLRAQGERNVVAIARRAHLYPAQRRALDALFEVARATIAVSALEPFDIPSLAGARTVVATYGDEEANIVALADVLAGRHDAVGRMPVALAQRRA